MSTDTETPKQVLARLKPGDPVHDRIAAWLSQRNREARANGRRPEVARHVIDALALYIAVQEGESVVIPARMPMAPPVDYPASPTPSDRVMPEPSAPVRPSPAPAGPVSPVDGSSVDRPAEPAVSGNTDTGESGATQGAFEDRPETFDGGRPPVAEGRGETPVSNHDNRGHSGGDFGANSGPFKGASEGSPEGSVNEANPGAKKDRAVSNILAQKDGYF